MTQDSFTIKHTAKNVDYNTTDFTFKNQDELDMGLDELIKSSTHPIIPFIF